MYTRTCLVCNEEFQSETHHRNICDKVHLKECVICGTEFEVVISNRDKKTCSQSCNAKLGFQNRTQKANCLFCGEEFIKRTNTHRYCKPKHVAHCPVCDKAKQYPNGKIEKQGDKLVATVTCGKKCQNQKTKETSLEKYGVENPSQSKEVQDKMKTTNLERYGAENVYASEYGKQKIKETNLERYGVENPMQNIDIQEKTRQTNFERYGGVAPAQNKEVQEKMKRTTFERYGTENAYASPEIQEKIKQTNLARYGTEYASQSEEVKKKIAQTNLERYGSENVYASDYGKQKIKETMLERYSVEHALQSEEFMEKFRRTNLKRYGTEYPGQSEEIKTKIEETMLEKYGVKNPNQKHIQHIEEWYNFEEYLKGLEEKPNCLELSKYFNLGIDTIREKIVDLSLQDYIDGFYKFSLPELYFKELLEAELPGIHFERTRKVIAPKEIDFYFPDYKLGVEISPTWTHKYDSNRDNERYASKYYHYNKFKAAEEQGVELITVFDWRDIDKVIQLIKSKIVNPEHTVSIEDCNIKYTNSLTKLSKDFLNEYHMLGTYETQKDKHILEVWHEDKLIGLAMYVQQPNNMVELKRLAIKDNYNITNGITKLVNGIFDIVGCSGITIVTDNDFETGSIYRELGFEMVEENRGLLVFYNVLEDMLIGDLELSALGADRLLSNFPGYTPVGIGPDKPGNREIVMSYGFEPMFDCGYRKWIFTK